MRRWIGVAVIIGLSVVMAGRVDAASTTITISEIQTGSSSSASQEFIELYNQSDHDISLTGWGVDYKSASGSSWTHKVSLTGTIYSHGFYLLGSSGYAINPDQTFTSGLSGSGGHIRLTDSGSVVIDLVGWGTASGAEGGHAAAAPAAGQSIERLPGRLNPTGGNGVDTEDNANDFIVRTSSEPQSTLAVAEAPDLTITSEPVMDDVAPDAPVYLPLMITELLPDPASPKTDAADEYIELYNPNDQDVNVAGYTLKVGSKFYILPASLLVSHGYITFYASSTHLALTNTGASVILLDPAGATLTTVTYTTAKSDQAWGYFDGAWKWTLVLTPRAENVLDEPVVAVAAAKAKSATLKAAASKVSVKTAPKSSAKTAAAKTTTAKKTTTAQSALANVASVIPQTSTGLWLIIGLATLTIGYAIYEYRTSLQNRIYLFRRQLSAWRANRTRP